MLRPGGSGAGAKWAVGLSWRARWGLGLRTDGGQVLRLGLSNEPVHVVDVRVGQGRTDRGSDREAMGGIIGRYGGK